MILSYPRDLTRKKWTIPLFSSSTRRHGCRFEADGAMRTASRASAWGFMSAFSAGREKPETKNSSSIALRFFDPADHRMILSVIPRFAAVPNGSYGRNHLFVRRSYASRKLTPVKSAAEPACPQAKIGQAENDRFHQITEIFHRARSLSDRPHNKTARPSYHSICAEPPRRSVKMARGVHQVESHITGKWREWKIFQHGTDPLHKRLVERPGREAPVR